MLLTNVFRKRAYKESNSASSVLVLLESIMLSNFSYYPQRMVSKKRKRKCESEISHTIRVLKLVLGIPVINLVALKNLKIFLFAKLQY